MSYADIFENNIMGARENIYAASKVSRIYSFYLCLEKYNEKLLFGYNNFFCLGQVDFFSIPLDVSNKWALDGPTKKSAAWGIN